jgi:hypothetical protein
LNDTNIFDTTLTWLNGSNSTSSRAGYAATLLSNGKIVFIRGFPASNVNDADIDAGWDQLTVM